MKFSKLALGLVLGVSLMVYPNKSRAVVGGVAVAPLATIVGGLVLAGAGAYCTFFVNWSHSGPGPYNLKNPCAAINIASIPFSALTRMFGIGPGFGPMLTGPTVAIGGVIWLNDQSSDSGSASYVALSQEQAEKMQISASEFNSYNQQIARVNQIQQAITGDVEDNSELTVTQVTERAHSMWNQAVASGNISQETRSAVAKISQYAIYGSAAQ